jgi:cellulose synthase/poly-beta-1,6-N-acetylglucosamine synthase-like glycosyltransferase
MMNPIIWCVLCCTFFLLAAHPFATYPLSLRLFRRAKGRCLEATGLGDADRPRVAICMCAYNEEAVIERKVRNMLELRRRHGALDILVYVDAATDRTAELLRPFAEEITVTVSPVRQGKTHGMNLLVEQASAASILVFTDANVIIDDASIDALVDAFRDPDVGCVCGHLVYVNPNGTPTAAVGSLYWRLEERIKDDEGAIGAAMGADGSLFAIRLHLHRPVPPHLIDDMFLSLSILCDGYRVVRAADAVAYEESVTEPVEEFRRKIRIACQAFNVHRILWPRLRRLPAPVVYMYLSHKLLRWLAIYSLALSAIAGAVALAFIGVPLYAIVLAAAAATALFWWGMMRRISPLAQIGEVLTAFAGTGIGLAQSLRGRQFQTWTPAASIRQSPR